MKFWAGDHKLKTETGRLANFNAQSQSEKLWRGSLIRERASITANTVYLYILHVDTDIYSVSHDDL